MDEFEKKSREIARAILDRHGWKRPMTAELKEMREVVDLPYTECKRYLLEEWQNMRVPLLEKENAKLHAELTDLRLGSCPSCGIKVENERLRELVRHLRECTRHNVCAVCEYAEEACDFDYDMRELGVDA